jgi:transposase, IS5 family
MQESFGSLEMAARVRRDSALTKAHALVNWEQLRPLLTGLYKREASRAGGQEPIDALLMFKATLLGQWHSLSDPKLEEVLRVRIDFMHFCGLSLSDTVPDETTLCRFRNRLIATGKLGPLLAAVNAQLQAHGLMVARATGAVVDATLIAAAARPRGETTIENDRDSDTQNNGGSSATQDVADSAPAAVAAVAAATTASPPSPPTVTHTRSVDPDATWLKKGSKSYFGFRTYTSVDAQDGYIRGVHSAPANQSETRHFEPALKSCDFTPERVYADKGFASQDNRAHLRSKAIKSAIMHKAQKNKPLSPRQKNANKRISKTRYMVEQCFGTMKRLFGMSRASYLGTTKVNAQFTLKAICFNLLKAGRKIYLTPTDSGRIRLVPA